jgi:hypothetical protein
MIFGVVDQETGDRPDGGGSKHLWNVGKILQDYNGSTTQEKPSPTQHILKTNKDICQKWN